MGTAPNVVSGIPISLQGQTVASLRAVGGSLRVGTGVLSEPIQKSPPLERVGRLRPWKVKGDTPTRLFRSSRIA